MALLGIAAWRILPALNRIISSLTRIRVAIPFIQSELEYLDQSVHNVESCNLATTDSLFQGFNRELKLKNVNFKYETGTNFIINNISFTIGKGETIGIIGASGSGKSTLVDLIIGLLAPVSGDLEIDSKPMNKDNFTNWVQHLGYVSQSPYIYDGSLVENVAFGVPTEKIDRKKVVSCCRMASMDFLEGLSDGIDTRVGERGIRLSGGQQQRIAIARALYCDPEVLIFDEATSSLDSKSEKAIQQTMYSFKGQRTLIIIAHRLSTVEECDRLLWIHDGKLRMMDKPDVVLPNYKSELLSKN